MAGKKGRKRLSSARAARRKIWQSMRIMRRFTMADLCRTSGAQISNVSKFIFLLKKHGYISPFGQYTRGRAGSYKSYRLIKDTGPEHPVLCNKCGNPLSHKCEKTIKGKGEN